MCLFHWAAPNNPLSQLPKSPQGKAKAFLKWNIQWLWEGSGRGKLIFPGDKAKHLQVGNSSVGSQGGDAQTLLLFSCVSCPKTDPQGDIGWWQLEIHQIQSQGAEVPFVMLPFLPFLTP